MATYISRQQHEEFRDRGLILATGLLPADKVDRALEAVWERLSARDRPAENGWRGESGKRNTSAATASKSLKGLTASKAFEGLIPSSVTGVLGDLLGPQAFSPMMDHAQLLFTPPNSDEWDVPHKMWHLDIPRLPDGDVPGVQIFACLDRVTPGGGATLVVAGSHRLLNTGEFIRSRDVKKRLKRHAWFRDLMSDRIRDRGMFLSGCERVGGVTTQVVELCGAPGDVYFVDMRTLHTVAPNAQNMPRVMLTQRYLRESCRAAVYGEGAARLSY